MYDKNYFSIVNFYIVSTQMEKKIHQNFNENQEYFKLSIHIVM